MLPETSRTGRNALGNAWVVPVLPNPIVHSPLEVLKWEKGVFGNAVESVEGFTFDRSTIV